LYSCPTPSTHPSPFHLAICPIRVAPTPDPSFIDWVMPAVTILVISLPYPYVLHSRSWDVFDGQASEIQGHRSPNDQLVQKSESQLD
jgi:hypothetical protein